MQTHLKSEPSRLPIKRFNYDTRVWNVHNQLTALNVNELEFRKVLPDAALTTIMFLEIKKYQMSHILYLQ